MHVPIVRVFTERSTWLKVGALKWSQEFSQEFAKVSEEFVEEFVSVGGELCSISFDPCIRSHFPFLFGK